MDDAADRLAAEAKARVLIDAQLSAAGWVVQDRRSLNLFAAQGVAVREVVMAAGHGCADYLPYVDKRAVGVLEAKPAGTTLSGVEWQSAMYTEGLPADVRLKALTVEGRLPFVLESSGTETHLTNGYDPAPAASPLPRARRPWPGGSARRRPTRSAPRGGRRSATCRHWMSAGFGRRRSAPSTVSSDRWPSSATTGPWYRWRPGRGRRSPR